METRTRIAPTPSGFLHIGNAFSFLLTALMGRKGQILLRIDDLDNARQRKEYVEDVFESLQWLGIEWHLGPSGPDDFYKNWSQHHRIELYQILLKTLQGTACVFACQCSRKDLETAGVLPGFYPGFCRNAGLSLSQANLAWRIAVDANEVIEIVDEKAGKVSFPLGKETGPFVIKRRDGLPSYQIASLADDLHFKINLIVRGADLLPSTAMQIFSAKTAGQSDFLCARFYHHPLVLGNGQEKLSKSAGSFSLKEMRHKGLNPDRFRASFAAWLNILPSPSSDRLSFQSLVDLFEEKLGME